MDITKRIKKIMIDKNITVTKLNELLNIKNNTNHTPQNLSKKLNKDDLKFNDAVDILNVLGYKIDIIEEDYKPNELFLFKDYKPEPSEQLKMIDDEDSIDPTWLNEIETTIDKEVKKKIESLVSSKVDDYFIKFVINKSPHDSEFESRNKDKK